MTVPLISVFSIVRFPSQVKVKSLLCVLKETCRASILKLCSIAGTSGPWISNNRPKSRITDVISMAVAGAAVELQAILTGIILRRENKGHPRQW